MGRPGTARAGARDAPGVASCAEGAGLMPTKRTPLNRARRVLHSVIVALIEGREIGDTAEARQELIGAIWFNAHPDLLTEEHRRRALEILGEFHRPERERMYA